MKSQEQLQKEIEEIILGYCQGIRYLEFDIEDLSKMSEEILKKISL
jgi:hypothetical protein